MQRDECRGRQVEFGAAAAYDRKIVIVGPVEHIFHRLPGVARVETTAQLLRWPATPGQIEDWLDQEHRRRWRCMLLIIKAKFEAVEMKLELAESELDRAHVFEQEFLACIVGTGGQTLYQAIQEAKVGSQRLLPPAEGF